MPDLYTPSGAFQGHDLAGLANIDEPRYLEPLQRDVAVVLLAKAVRDLQVEVVRLRGELETMR